MKTSVEITFARINPHIVGWYLINELKQLQDLKRYKDHLLQTQHPLYAKKIDEIYAFSAKKKHIESSINRKLHAYEKSFDSDEPLSLDEMIDYFEEQLVALNAKKTIEQIVIDVAYAAHEQAEKNHLINAGKMGNRLFETVHTNGQEEEPRQVSDAPRNEPPVVSSKNLATTSMLNAETAPLMPLSQKKAMANSTLSAKAPPFIPLTQRKTVPDSINGADQKKDIPEMPKHSLHQNLINSSLIFGESWEYVTSIEPPNLVDEPFENSKLYRLWQKTNDQAQEPWATNTTSFSLDVDLEDLSPKL